jgi:hypothetical protein
MFIVGLILFAAIAIGTAAIGGWMLRGLPSKSRANAIKETLWDRRGATAAAADRTDIRHGDQMITYLERVIDRQINKARGILPFNSIIIAFLAIERARISYGFDDAEPVHRLILAGLFAAMVGLAVSSLLCLLLFLVRWGEAADYASFGSEVHWTVHALRRRSRIIECAVILSIGSLLLSGAVVFMAELTKESSSKTSQTGTSQGTTSQGNAGQGGTIAPGAAPAPTRRN